MIQGKSVLAVIPARGGSKGLPRKNIRMLAGKPLIAWTIEEARQSEYIDRLILSSEDPEIIHTAQSFGCEVPFVRPSDLAGDNTPGIDPILHAIGLLPGYDIVMILQPTSPLRMARDIDEGLEFFIQRSASVCVSVSEMSKSPYWMFSLDPQNYMQPIFKHKEITNRRQDLPKIYMPNGALFISRTAYLEKKRSFYTDETMGFIMPKEKCHDIDDEMDFLFIEFLINTRYQHKDL
ncbi:MAG: acylneuraminate cytidylyltransferase family protein [Desulfobacteraceae bacterium]|nr:acylneuraminate cytidylyltransferase family protein [Desulfobacteraceae bacterium]